MHNIYPVNAFSALQIQWKITIALARDNVTQTLCRLLQSLFFEVVKLIQNIASKFCLMYLKIFQNVLHLRWNDFSTVASFCNFFKKLELEYSIIFYSRWPPWIYWTSLPCFIHPKMAIMLQNGIAILSSMAFKGDTGKLCLGDIWLGYLRYST